MIEPCTAKCTTMRLWIGTALLAGSWLLGLDYFYPANPWGWIAVIAAANFDGIDNFRGLTRSVGETLRRLRLSARIAK